MMYRLGFAGLVAALMGGPQLAYGQSALQPVLVSTVQSDWSAATSSQPSGSESWSPEVIESTTPDFPRRALTEGIGGQCDATFQVDRNGYAANIQLECTPEMFSGSTMDAIRDWRFTPWTGEGSLSPWTTLPISYNLPGASDTRAPVEDSPPAKQPDSRVDNGEGASDERGMIGIQINPVGDRFYIGQIIDNGPAARAGLRLGDEITAVDGVSVAGTHIDAVMGALAGRPGDDVTMRIFRASESDSLDVTLTRESARALAAAVMPRTPMRTDLPVGGGESAQSARITELFSDNFRGTTDVFIYAPTDLASDAAGWLNWYADQLRNRGLQVGMSSDFGADDGFVAARVFVAANRIIEPRQTGVDLDLVQARFCGTPVDGFIAATISNWGRDHDYLQWGFMDDRRRQAALADSRQASTRDIREQLTSHMGALDAAIREREPCLAPQIFSYPQGLSPSDERGFLDRGFDFGWTFNGARGWNIENAYPFLEIDAPQLGRRPNEYYVEYLAEVASVFSDDTLSVALAYMIANDLPFSMLGMIDPTPPAPEFHARESQFIRSNYRLMSGHTLLTYLIERDFDPVLLRRLFTHGVLDFEAAMYARDRFGRSPAFMLIERGIPPEVLEPDYQAYLDMVAFEYPQQPTGRMIEAAIVGDNPNALAWLVAEGADLEQVLEAPGRVYSRQDFEFSAGPLTPIELAAALGRQELVIYLASLVGVDFQNPVSGRTALFHTYASETDLDGYPVPRTVGGQVAVMSSEDALAMQTLLLSMGADPDIRDAQGQTVLDFQQRVSQFQQERNRREAASRAEERDRQGTLSRWRNESRQQMWSAFGQGVVTGLRNEGERLAAAERRRQAEQARRDALNQPVGRVNTSEANTSSEAASSQSRNQASAAGGSGGGQAESSEEAATQGSQGGAESGRSGSAAPELCVPRSSFQHPDHSAYRAEREALIARLDQERETRVAQLQPHDWQGRNQIDRELRDELAEWDRHEESVCGRSNRASNAIAD